MCLLQMEITLFWFNICLTCDSICPFFFTPTTDQNHHRKNYHNHGNKQSQTQQMTEPKESNYVGKKMIALPDVAKKWGVDILNHKINEIIK